MPSGVAQIRESGSESRSSLAASSRHREGSSAITASVGTAGRDGQIRAVTAVAVIARVVGPMPAVTVPWITTCTVLAIAGLAKLRRPDPTRGALEAAGLPGSRPVVLALGAGELGLAVVAVATGAPVLALAVAALYVGFAVFVLAARRRDGMLQTCGCFGSPDVPATWTHVAVNLLAATVAAVAAATAIGRGAGLTATGQGVVAVVLAALATFQVLIVLTVLPRARMDAVAATPGLRW